MKREIMKKVVKIMGRYMKELYLDSYQKGILDGVIDNACGDNRAFNPRVFLSSKNANALIDELIDVGHPVFSDTFEYEDGSEEEVMWRFSTDGQEITVIDYDKYDCEYLQLSLVKVSDYSYDEIESKSIVVSGISSIFNRKRFKVLSESEYYAMKIYNKGIM